MKNSLILLFALLLNVSIGAQTYSVSYFPSTYDDLLDYNNLTNELIASGEFPFSWEHTFDLGFNMPFYGEIYDQVILTNDGYGLFPGSEYYNLYLFGSYLEIHNVINDTIDNDSEIRYKTEVVEDVNALVVEYHNVYNPDAMEGFGENHYLNFQYWFYENGIIDIRFGDIDLSNCSSYLPGQGFNYDGIYGPWVLLMNQDESEGVCLFGDYTDPVSGTGFYDCGVLTSIPPPGSVIRFGPTELVSIDEIIEGPTLNYNVALEVETLKILGDLSRYQNSTIYDLSGRNVSASNEPIISTSGFTHGIYILEIQSEFGIESHKVIL